MKTLFIYMAVLIFCVFLFLVMISATPVPEALIQGEWKEMNWKYETIKKGKDESARQQLISEEVKRKIGQHLVIHTAETWRFLPDHKLELRKGPEVHIVDWTIKGRGHVLQLRYNENSVEHYNIVTLSNNIMQLNFDTDVQARGIAKLTFRRVNN